MECVPLLISWTVVEGYSHRHLCRQQIAPDFGWSAEAMSFDQPLLVVGHQPTLDRMTQLHDRVKCPPPQKLFLERAKKSLRDVVVLPLYQATTM